MKEGAWMPLAVLVIGVLVWLTIKNYRADAVRREEMLLKMVDENKAESHAREERLMDHLAKTDEAHAKIASTLERIEIRMQYIEQAVNIEGKAS
jgi:uncharacterized membrane-anchored protein YhcB (DUF1043 family)